MTISADDNYSRCSQCGERFETEALTERGDDLWCRHCIEDEESPGVAVGERQSGESPVSDGGRKANAPAVIPEPRCTLCNDTGIRSYHELPGPYAVEPCICGPADDGYDAALMSDERLQNSTRQPVSAGHIRD